MKKGLLVLSLALAGAPALGADLLQVYRDAVGYDAQFASAKSAWEAGQEKLPQGRAGLLPVISASANTTWNELDFSRRVPGTANTDASYNTNGYQLTLTQPLFRWQNYEQYGQSKLAVAQADALFSQAKQDLILRVSQAYFEVLLAQANLETSQMQKTAIGEQLEAAKRNFEVGTATITDSREAEAQYDLIQAEEISVENDVRVKRLALELIVGRPANELKPLARPVVLPPVTPGEPEPWVQIAYDNSPTVQQARLALEIAKLGVNKAYAGHKPTLDLNASYGNNRYPGGTSSSGFYTRTTSGTVGLAFNLPVFSGFLVQNQVKEALALEEKAKSDLDNAERSVAQFTRAAVFSLKSGLGKVKALETAETSTQSALDANMLGYQVGVRINLDVLNSQTKLFATKRDLDQTRYNVLVGGLRLRQAAGTLKVDDLNAVNGLLAK